MPGRGAPSRGHRSAPTMPDRLLRAPASSLGFGWGQAGGAQRCPPRPFPSCQVLVPTRVGQAYVYDSPKGEQDEYDFPRHLVSAGSQEIYDVPPVRGGVPSQFSQEVRRVVGLWRGGVGVVGGSLEMPWHSQASKPGQAHCGPFLDPNQS